VIGKRFEKGANARANQKLVVGKDDASFFHGRAFGYSTYP